jgi:hypothetical protein
MSPGSPALLPTEGVRHTGGKVERIGDVSRRAGGGVGGSGRSRRETEKQTRDVVADFGASGFVLHGAILLRSFLG